jgi:hypothetical protein
MSDWPHHRQSTLTHEKAPPKTPMGLTDAELRAVMAAARGVDPEKRDVLLRRFAAELEHRTRDVRRALNTALRGLHQGEQGGDAA